MLVTTFLAGDTHIYAGDPLNQERIQAKVRIRLEPAHVSDASGIEASVINNGLINM